MTTLFISDLHLQIERPHISRAFFDFLNQQAQGAEALYILGDFFNVWLGDDNHTSLSDEVAQRLKQLSQQGTKIYLMHGNRDFLIGHSYCHQAGATLLDDPTVIELYGTPVLLMHGDSLCLQDISYQRYRKIIRSRFISALQHIIPLSLRLRIAGSIQGKSKKAKIYKSAQIMDVTPDEVNRQFQQHSLTSMVHGHTHRPAIHQDQQQQRIVLGDWEQQGWYLSWHPDGSHQLLSFDIDPDSA
ncbi:MAG: UDP-2,3-diacylglucosamine diphosphatase [Motiliproteus sp.]